MDKKPKYLSEALHDAVMSMSDGNRVRWQCISKRTGRVVVASEWVPSNRHTRQWVEEMIEKVNAERAAARAKGE